MAANNSSSLGWDEISANNITNTAGLDQTFCEKLASVPSVLFLNKDMLALEAQIVFTALACIYIGSYGSLRRPPSAKPPKPSKNGNKKQAEEREDQHVSGLLPSDAILFPIMAGTTLIGLYYLIKWLEEPDILNRILKGYFSTMSLASLGKLIADGLSVLTGFIFPSVWTNGYGKIYHIDPEKREQRYVKSGTNDQILDKKKISPLPGPLSELQLSDKTIQWLWEIRRLLLEHWTVRLVVHGLVKENLGVKFNDIVGVVFALGANILYYTTDSMLLSNMLGYAFSYTGIVLLSPTTFATGSSVLFGLFFYDIVMVFYTPFMVTVATKLDAPIKLVFQGPGKASMLGLGDIVIPGMFVGLCLRFDHYMYYYRQLKFKKVELETNDASSGQVVTTSKTAQMLIKPDYVNPRGQWGDRFWGTKLSNMLSPDATPALLASAFPKPYFHAAMAGYFLAMVATLLMLLTFNHAQPALLYLVPGVVLAVWITGAVRGELREMWTYTEDGSLDQEDIIAEVDENGKIIGGVEFKNKKDEDDKEKSADEKSKKTEEKGSDGAATVEKEENSKAERYPVFLLSIEAPTP
ncbi:signal peptide peptidase-domain-containing protein [Nemania sp. FL0916]|nr:signal peptide peptidase-domain-containing protein [Nemania sp. FL0916]